MPTNTDIRSPKDTDNEKESLLSEASLLLSLAPPRAPPYHTIHRSIYTQKHHCKKSNNNHNNKNCNIIALHPYNYHRHVHRKVNTLYHYHHQQHQQQRKLKKQNNYHLKYNLHPHLSFSPESANQLTRNIFGHILPIHLQNKYRDNGTFRSLSDSLVMMSVPSLALVHWRAMVDFIRLTRRNMVEVLYYDTNVSSSRSNSNSNNSRSKGHKEERRKIDLFIPNHVEEKDIKGLVFFVHGGAWGSGMPWMYRLVASPFIKQQIAVAIVGYRTYPDGHVQDQVNDLHHAAEVLAMKYPHLWRNKQKKKDNQSDNGDHFGVCLMGHSSGAHISLLFLIQLIEQNLRRRMHNQPEPNNCINFDSYIGLSGVYNIQHHFDYEAGRGVEEISPLKPACGYSRSAFDTCSPVLQLHSLMRLVGSKQCSMKADQIISTIMPRMLLVHGIEDNVVPFTSTSEAARIIRSCGIEDCYEHYLSKTGHADVIMHFMLGGKCVDGVMTWLKKRNDNNNNMMMMTTAEISSKL